jgi:nucleoside-diphosphate-sugar epimerase
MSIQEIHSVIGAGATGSATAELLADLGHSVRVITRSGSGPKHTNIELIKADASDVMVLTAATQGSQVIYNCANPPYDKWVTAWPPLADALLNAAATNDAVLVTLSNLYGYGLPDGPMQESDPLTPNSVKGGVRAQMWADALAAHNAGQVRVTEARASDFIGPGLGENGHMGDRVVPRVLNGKSISVMGKPDMTHSWTAISDVARTLVTLGSDERAWGKAWHVPTAAPLSQRQLIARMSELAGVEPVKVKSIPAIAMTLGGLVVSSIRELKEVAYQFENPFVIDSSRTEATFGLEPTSLDETLKETLASYSN